MNFVAAVASRLRRCRVPLADRRAAGTVRIAGAMRERDTLARGGAPEQSANAPSRGLGVPGGGRRLRGLLRQPGGPGSRPCVPPADAPDTPDDVVELGFRHPGKQGQAHEPLPHLGGHRQVLRLPAERLFVVRMEVEGPSVHGAPGAACLDLLDETVTVDRPRCRSYAACREAEFARSDASIIGVPTSPRIGRTATGAVESSEPC